MEPLRIGLAADGTHPIFPVRLPSQHDVMARTVTNKSGTKLADLQLVKKSSVSSFKEGGESHKNLRKPLQIIAELEQMTQATL